MFNKNYKKISTCGIIGIFILSMLISLSSIAKSQSNTNTNTNRIIPQSASTNNSINQIAYWNSVDLSANNLEFNFPDLSSNGIFQQHAICMPNAPISVGNAVPITLSNGSQGLELESKVSFTVIYDFYTTLSTVELGVNSNSNTVTYLGLCENVLGSDTNYDTYDDQWSSMTSFRAMNNNMQNFWDGYSGQLQYYANVTDLSPSYLSFGNTQIGVENIGFLANVSDVSLLGSSVYEHIGTGSNNLVPDLTTNTPSNANSHLSVSDSVDTTAFETPKVYNSVGLVTATTDQLENDGFQNVANPQWVTEGYIPINYVASDLQGGSNNIFYGYSWNESSAIDGSAGYETQPMPNSMTYNYQTNVGSFDMALAPAISLQTQNFNIGFQDVEVDGNGNIYHGIWASGYNTNTQTQQFSKCNGFVINDRDLRMIFNVTANLYAITHVNAITSNFTYSIPNPINGNTVFFNTMYQANDNYTAYTVPFLNISIPAWLLDDLLIIALVIGVIVVLVLLFRGLGKKEKEKSRKEKSKNKKGGR